MWPKIAHPFKHLKICNLKKCFNNQNYKKSYTKKIIVVSLDEKPNGSFLYKREINKLLYYILRT